MTAAKQDLVTDGAAGGPYTAAAEQELRRMLGGGTPILTTSCTDALEMAAILADIQPGDEVIVPSFGFVTTALAFVRAGATIRFADIEPETLGLDPSSVEKALKPSTKVIVPIHYGGVPARMKELSILASDGGATVVEDAAHGLGGTLDGTPIGTLAPLAALSFHASKNFSCGEGGALVVNDDTLTERARIILEKGTDRRAFLDGSVEKYTWQDMGSSFGLSDFLAERLLKELEDAAAIQEQRQTLHETYDKALAAASELGFRTPYIPANASSAYHLYCVVLDEPSGRDLLLHRLREHGVAASFHFVPLHRTPGGRRWGLDADCPVSDRVAESIIRLPLHQRMSVDEAERNAAVFLDLARDLR